MQACSTAWSCLRDIVAVRGRCILIDAMWPRTTYRLIYSCIYLYESFHLELNPNNDLGFSVRQNHFHSSTPLTHVMHSGVPSSYADVHKVSIGF